MGKLSFDSGKFYFQADTVHEEKLARDSALVRDGFRWHTRNPTKAVALRRFADVSAEIKFKKYFITDLESPECIVYPDHLSPRTFQLESAWHALTRTPCYIADEAGLGKTIVACLCMNTVPGKALIICPPFLKYNWEIEIKKWTTHKSVSVINGALDPNIHISDVVILPDSLVARLVVEEALRDRHFTWLFVDEAHRYKEDKTQRTIALLGDDESEFAITDTASRIVFLSGTPIPNGRPIELYPLLSQVAPETIEHQSRIKYGKRYCGGKQVREHPGSNVFHWDFRGSSRLDTLNKKLKRKFMIRHEKKDVLTELPEKTRKIVFLDAPDQILKYDKKHLTDISIDELIGDDGTLGDIAKYRRLMGIQKIDSAVEYIVELLNNTNEKLVVFAHHIEVVESIAYQLQDLDFYPLIIRGGMNANMKQGSVNAFQKKEKHRVIVGNMDAMGVGNTLTKAPGVVIVEPSWVPGVNEQAEDRVHRMTQEKNVYIHYLVLRDSLDERMLSAVLNKQKSIDQVMA